MSVHWQEECQYMYVCIYLVCMCVCAIFHTIKSRNSIDSTLQKWPNGAVCTYSTYVRMYLISVRIYIRTCES